MTIANLGTLHFGLTPQLLFERHKSQPWPPIIASVLYRMGTIEQWGTRTLNRLAWRRQMGVPAPVYVEQTDAVIVRFLLAQPELRPESLADVPLSRSDLAARLGQRTVPGQLNVVIRRLLREGRIAYTIPEKPQSRLQRYRVVETRPSELP